jgi:hypothetical protein
MKKLILLLIIAGLVSAVQAAEVWFDDAGDLSSWGVSEYVAAEYITVESTWADVDTNGKEFWLTSWPDDGSPDGSWTDIWTGSGVTITADQAYTLTVKMGGWDTGTEGDEQGTQPAGAADQVWFAMEDWGASATLAENYQWLDNSTGDSEGYANYTVSFDTFAGNNAASIGNEIGVSISSIGWWNNFSVSEMNITAVPEPCTMLLLGLGGLVTLRRKR